MSWLELMPLISPTPVEIPPIPVAPFPVEALESHLNAQSSPHCWLNNDPMQQLRHASHPDERHTPCGESGRLLPISARLVGGHRAVCAPKAPLPPGRLAFAAGLQGKQIRGPLRKNSTEDLPCFGKTPVSLGYRHVHRCVLAGRSWGEGWCWSVGRVVRPTPTFLA
jgi:hypothetical protein